MTTQGALEAGRKVGHYEIVRRLGSGGMGEVYLARDTRLGRSVALKILRGDADPELLRRLDREARAASSLNHPNVVHIYDVGHPAGDDGPHYVVMEHVEGETLRVRLAASPLALPQVLEWGAQIAAGLAVAHQAGIVHRDLKPENLMVTRDGTVKILDFGLARLLATTPLGDLEDRATLSRHTTQQGMLVGTIQYMSPEQARGTAADSRADQFALGLVLYEMLAGRPAFLRPTAVEVLAAIIERDPVPLPSLRPDLPAALVALVTRCLQKEPQRRFADTGEIARTLRELSTGSTGGSRAAAPRADSIAEAQIVRGPLVPEIDDESISWSVQHKNRTRTYDGKKLAESIRRGKLTGMEMVRRDDAQTWQPLYESRIYERLVPVSGKPREAARWRQLRGLGGHFTGFFVTGAVMYATQGHIPFWMAFWAIGLVSHVANAAPALMELLPLRLGPAADPAPQRLAAVSAPASPMAVEASRVRELVAARGGADAPSLLAEVDRVLALTEELATRERDLQEQTSPTERAALTAAEAEAAARLERTGPGPDRRLFERQLEVVRQRQGAVEKALRVLDRLRVRREMAEHQLKQLRLDLSRGAAGGLDVPELSSRLQFIRHEVDAAEDVEEMLAGKG